MLNKKEKEVISTYIEWCHLVNSIISSLSIVLSLISLCLPNIKDFFKYPLNYLFIAFIYGLFWIFSTVAYSFEIYKSKRVLLGNNQKSDIEFKSTFCGNNSDLSNIAYWFISICFFVPTALEFLLAITDYTNTLPGEFYFWVAIAALIAFFYLLGRINHHEKLKLYKECNSK